MTKLLAVLSLLAFAPAHAADAGPDVPKIFSTWVAGYEARDIAKLMSVFSKDYRYSFQGEPDQGYDAMAASYADDFKSQERWRWSQTVESVDVDGKLAVAISRWTAFSKNAGSATESIALKLRSVDLLRLDQGEWKIFRTVNYPESP
jgi:ketosteroid isomerase-like protein